MPDAEPDPTWPDKKPFSSQMHTISGGAIHDHHHCLNDAGEMAQQG